MAVGRDPRTAFYLAVGYLLWSIVPHYHLLIHSHAGGAHSHAALTGAQVRLANSVLDGLGPAGLSAGADDIGGVEAPVPMSGEPTLASGPRGVLHVHFWEDSNLASLVSLPGFALLGADFLAAFFSRYRSPALSLSGLAFARGPPALRFA
jgi:hypothetical protein